MPASFVPLAEIVRGGTVESLHLGAVAIVDRDGRLVYSAGDPDFVTFTRSSLKPFQALPFVAAGGIERYKLTTEETALLCASHSGEPRHVAAAGSILVKAGNRATELQCGTHAPGHYEVHGEVPPPPPYSPLAHNCSGKHAGMLAHCAACGYGKSDYLAMDHPLQREVRVAVATLSGVPEEALPSGVDGCSAPNYAMPLSRLALAFAQLASDDVHPVYGRAPRQLADAMIAAPGMVSGDGRSDLALTEAGRGDWVCKIGAEAVQAIGIRSRGWGIAVKVGDGTRRALLPATVAVLDQAGLLDADARKRLAPLGRPTIRNYRGIATGETRPTVVLDKADRPLTPVAHPAAE